MKRQLLLLICLVSSYFAYAQNNNGLIDQLEELATKETVEIPLPGGASLATDVFLPITSDSLAISLDILGQQIMAEIIPKGTQLIIYPEMLDGNGGTIANPNPYQLPMLFGRTPYGKDGLDPAGYFIPLLGYAFVFQDVRGRLNSSGTNLPLYSDGWQKAAYNNDNNLLDLTNSSDSANGRFHEDGWTTYQYLLNDLQKDFDLDGDGFVDTTATVCNGTLGTFGASAFAIPHFQLAASHRIDPNVAGLKSMVSLIATAEHYRYTGYHNGVLREQLIYEWLGGQINDLDESGTADSSLQNNIHTPSDYGQITNQAVLDLAIDNVTTHKYAGQSVTTAYPNSVGRSEMDVSAAPVDAMGEGDANGQFSRYTNMDVPNYNLTGWYDIFVDGQISTWDNMRSNISGTNNKLQKLVIGPWAHTTITMQSTGDMTYPENVGDVLGLNIDINDFTSLLTNDLSKLMQIELVTWMRYTMNKNGHVPIGEPIARIPESQNWQNVGPFALRIPSDNYDMTLVDFFNFLFGASDLPDFPVEVDLGFGPPLELDLNIPAIASIFPVTDPIEEPADIDFANDIPDVRLYVIGPNDSLPENDAVGNYWLAADEFPLTGPEISYTPLYLHSNGILDWDAPTSNEGLLMYVHDPNDPVMTVGGGNLFVELPNGDDSHGQMNLADSAVIDLTMNHDGVLQFETSLLTDTVSMIGFPKVTLYAKSEPQGFSAGETNTDFFVRIVDVYPDGREFYVMEGALNARAREYTRSIYNGAEDVNASFSNININELYELQFQMQPIAYTFGKNHQIKILLSSSNYPRYQSNPNLPMEPGDFFRRQPNDGKTYTFQGVPMSPRIAYNSVAFSPTMASRIELPLYKHFAINTNKIAESSDAFEVALSPNPAASQVLIDFQQSGAYQINLYNNLGQLLSSQQLDGNKALLFVEELPTGVYRVELVDEVLGTKVTKSLVKR